MGRPCLPTKAALRTLWLAIAVASVTGCAVGPNYVPPKPRAPDAWHLELTEGLAEGRANLQTWWAVLDDPVLRSLIERAGAGNLRLKEAVARIREARARRGVARGEFFPRVDSIGTYQRTRQSEDFSAPGADKEFDFFETGLDSSWEIDLFGRIRRSVESATASLDASIEDYRDVLVVLYAEVALTYVEIRSLQLRMSFT